MFANCIPTNMVVLDPVLPSNMTLPELMKVNKKFQTATRMFGITSPTNEKLNFTVVEFEEEAQGTDVDNSLTFRVPVFVKEQTVDTMLFICGYFLCVKILRKCGFISDHNIENHQNEPHSKFPHLQYMFLANLSLRLKRAIVITHHPLIHLSVTLVQVR